ncbi:MAG: translation initiation factor 2 [Rhodobacteraceae bacterium]|nr:MAG: translation initiation factor 2 [Paracoccaceae bacterium]
MRLISILILFLFSSCGSITRGTTEVLEIKTDPSGAKVETSNNMMCSSTPCGLKMKRNSELNVIISKKGCNTLKVNVTNQVANAGAASMAGNAILGGVIGVGVDAYTGASMELVPNPIDVKLECN